MHELGDIILTLALVIPTGWADGLTMREVRPVCEKALSDLHVIPPLQVKCIIKLSDRSIK